MENFTCFGIYIPASEVSLRMEDSKNNKYGKAILLEHGASHEKNESSNTTVP